MQFAIVLTAVLALATAATLPSQKLDSQNELFESNENNNKNEYTKVEHDSIDNSFDAIVNIIRQYKNDVTKTDNSKNNEISVPDTIDIGLTADTLLTDVRVKGLNDFDSQNITMTWGEDLIHVANSWKKLVVTGMFHYMNTVARHNGIFHLEIIEPKYKGKTMLTKNSNVYPLMSNIRSVEFAKFIVNHTALPEVFQNDKPQFDNLVKNTIPQCVATAEANNMYNDFVMQIRRSVKPYMVYRSNKLTTDIGFAAVLTGNLTDGLRFELKNLDFDNSKNNLAKISFVQVSKTSDSYSAKLELRLWNLAGEFESVISSPDGKTDNRRATYTTNTVKVVCDLDFVENSARTTVHVIKPQIQFIATDSNSTVNWSNVQKQLVPQFSKFLVRTLETAVDRKVQQSMM